jgi:DNA-binding CsgD family transcriptional regulator
VAAGDLLVSLLRDCDPCDRRLLDLLLAGHEPKDCAVRLGCSAKTVYRGIDRLRRRLAALLN